MDAKEFLHDIIITVAYVLIFLGLQGYLKAWIDQYPWAFITIGILLFINARKISGWGYY